MIDAFGWQGTKYEQSQGFLVTLLPCACAKLSGALAPTLPLLHGVVEHSALQARELASPTCAEHSAFALVPL